MRDLIDREQAIKALRGAEARTYAFGYHNVYEAIRGVPSAEHKQGKWMKKPDPYGFFDEIPVCSECGCTTKLREEYKYCPHCGAKMSEIPTDSESEDKK